MTIIHDNNMPAGGVVLITPSDTVNLTNATRAIRVEVGGDVRVLTTLGQDVVCAFLSGETRPIMALRVFATNTTATGIEGMY